MENEAPGYRQRAEKSTGGDMTLMQWSPTMDLLAAAYADHSVVLNRLSWRKVWATPPVEAPCTALAWRPDGRVLAVGRSDGTVSLLQWIALDEGEMNPSDGASYSDDAQTFLPPLPALEASTVGLTEKLENSEQVHPRDPKLMKTPHSSMNLLVIGDELGRVHLCVAGVFLIASYENHTHQQQGSGPVVVADLSPDLRRLLWVVLTQEEGESHKRGTLSVRMLGTHVLARVHRELQYVAVVFGQVVSLMEYMSSTLKLMHEGWEDTLALMDSKLANYTSTLPEGRSVADELLVLLACGRASQGLQSFLIDDLTAKGVKKLGASMELSYTNIRRYVVNHLSSAIQHLQYHLGELMGVARWTDRFGHLGITESAVYECMSCLGTFALKANELLFCIDDSLHSIKVFFAWLYVVILKLSSETVPEGHKESLSLDHLRLVVDFLRKRLTKASHNESRMFNLELVGQYLVNEDLKYVEEKPQSFWDKLTREAGMNAEQVPWMFGPSQQKSLVQLFSSLHKSIDDAFGLTAASIGSRFTPEIHLDLSHVGTETGSLLRTVQNVTGVFAYGGETFLYFPEETDLVIVRYGENRAVHCSKILVRSVPALQRQEGEYHICHMTWYDAETLSLLVRCPHEDEGDGNRPVYAVAQLPIAPLVAMEMWEETGDRINSAVGVDIGALLTQAHMLGVFSSRCFAVNGNRKLAAVLSSNGRTIKLFDTEAEEDIEEVEEVT
ncbi:hypothetical protein EMCRGX_G002035 [Ephydatia muelleri]